MSKNVIEAFESKLGTPVILVGASTRTDIVTHLGHDAARFLRTIRGEIDASHVTVVFIGSGGETAFAEHAWHALVANDRTYDVVVTDHVTGGFAALALGAERRFLMDGATIGAFDVAPSFEVGTPIDADGYDDVPALGGLEYGHDPELPSRLAWGYGYRRRARNLVGRMTSLDSALVSVESIGRDGGRSRIELAEAGWSSDRFLDADAANALEDIERELGLRTAPIVRYEPSGIADEVEFEMAVGVTTGLIASATRSWIFERDTGSPDPDSGVYRGEWGER